MLFDKPNKDIEVCIFPHFLKIIHEILKYHASDPQNVDFFTAIVVH